MQVADCNHCICDALTSAAKAPLRCEHSGIGNWIVAMQITIIAFDASHSIAMVLLFLLLPPTRACCLHHLNEGMNE